jgi:hypothetical protein
VTSGGTGQTAAGCAVAACPQRGKCRVPRSPLRGRRRQRGGHALDCVPESVTVAEPERGPLPVRVRAAHVEHRGTSGSNRLEESLLISSPSRDGTTTDDGITSAEPKECRGPADGKDRSIRGLDSNQVQHFQHRDLGAHPFEVFACQIDPSLGEGTAQWARTNPFAPVLSDDSYELSIMRRGSQETSRHPIRVPLV